MNVKNLLLAISCATCLTPVIAMNSSQPVASSIAISVNNSAESYVVVDDSKLSYDLSLKLNSMYPGNNIKVAANMGHVLLTGQVASDDIKSKIAQEVKSCNGVKGSWDYLTVEENENSIQTKKDHNINSKAIAKLETVKGITSSDLEVITTQRKVYIMGNVTQEQGKAITNKLGRVALVKAVVPLFDYSN